MSLEVKDMLAEHMAELERLGKRIEEMGVSL